MKILDTKPEPGMPIRHSTFYKAIIRMAKAWEKLSVDNGHVDWSNGIPTIVTDDEDGAGVATDYSDFALGFLLNPDGDNTAEVQINAGEIDRIAVAAAKIVVTDDYFVYVRRTIADDTMLVAAAASVPADDATYKYYRLHQFSVTDGVASIKLACRPFDIEGLPPIPAGAYTGSTYALMVNQVGGVPVIQWIETEEFSCP